MNKRQYIILSFFLTRILFLGGGFSLLINISQNNLLFTGFLGMLLGYFLLYLFYKKGNIHPKMLILISIVVLFITLLSNGNLTSTYLLSETPVFLVTGSFVLLLFYGVSKERKMIGRISEICIVYSLFIILVASIALFSLVKLSHLLPLFTCSYWNFVKGIILFAGASLLPNLLLLPYKENLKFKEVGIGYLWGSFTILLIMFFILGIYGAEFASILRFPEYLILRKINFHYISNIENIFILEWLANIMIGSLLAIKTLKEHTSLYHFATILVFLVLSNLFLLSHNYLYLLYVKRYYYVVTFLLTLLALFIKKGKNLD